MAIEDQPNLLRRVENALVALLDAEDDLDGVSIRNGVDESTVETPYIVVNASRQAEVIYNSGIQEVLISIKLKTTTGNGTKATDDETFLAYDAAIESVIWGDSMSVFATAIQNAGQYIKVYAAKNPFSQPAAFDDTRREIDFGFTLHVISVS